MDHMSENIKINLKISIKKITKILLLAIIIIPITACVTDIQRRGYLTGGVDVDTLKPGMTQQQIIDILGSPSMTAVFDENNNAYYYVSDTIKRSGFLDPELIDRKILAIRFDSKGRAGHILQYDINDSKVIQFVSDKTEVSGQELSIIEQLIGNIGRFDPAGSPSP